MNARLDLKRHPCFNAEVKGHCGRIHLPVAPRCNIKCNYCNRKFDCVNESRPGVSSALLTPIQAVGYLEKVMERQPAITVVGIAGPGDPFANAEETLETLRLVRKRFPDMLLCLASNGLNLSAHLDELAALEVSHVTVTVNAVDPEIGARIYSWVRDGKVIYRGLKAAELLLERQIEAIEGLKARGIVVKVNTIVVPGVNDHHVEAVARRMKELGVDLLNCMPMYPNAETPFEKVPEPTAEEMAGLQAEAEKYLPQMRHCTRCRADAVGLLGADCSHEFQETLSACARSLPSSENRPYVAVVSLEGILVNLHLGEAPGFMIWGRTEDGDYTLIEKREAPNPGNGPQRWKDLARVLSDCRAVLVSGVGEAPRKILTECGIVPVEMNGFIEMGLDVIYKGGNMNAVKGRRMGCGKGGGCKSNGEGCG